MSLVFICAHPDDEAFGPGATLARFSQKEDVFIICVTDAVDKTRKYKGNINKNGELKSIRRKELKDSAIVLGIKAVYFLEFGDGELRNNIYHIVAKKIEKILTQIKPDKIMTFEPRGVSGHIDHIFVSMVTSYLFQKLDFAKTLYYYCLPHNQTKNRDYFIYFPPGYKENEIDLIIDCQDFWDKKCEAIMCHKSQLDDPNKLPEWVNKRPKKEHFLVTKKHSKTSSIASKDDNR